MDSLLNSFGFNPIEFHDLLSRTGCFVAGGAVAHILRGNSTETFDGDIDIWYPNSPGRNYTDEVVSEDDQAKRGPYTYAIDEVTNYLKYHGYNYDNHDTAFTIEYTNKENLLSTQIMGVTSFVCMKKRVQMICAFNSPEEVLNTFDYSFCAVGYKPDIGFFGKELELTKEGKGYKMNPAKTPGRDAMRLEKYMKRDFTVIEKPD
jgi:hypothetical protein